MAAADQPTLEQADIALQQVFSEGTVVGSFVIVAIAIVLLLYNLALWLINVQRARNWTVAREAEAKRLLQYAESIRQERQALQAVYANPIQSNVHLPGSVSYEEVMGSAPDAPPARRAANSKRAAVHQGRRAALQRFGSTVLIVPRNAEPSDDGAADDAGECSSVRD